MKQININKQLMKHYDIDLNDKYIQNHLTELIYCYEHDKSLIDFDWWTHIEDLLNKKISYEAYTKINSQYDCDLMELDIKDVPNLIKLVA